ncbi:NAD(P)/FAD-dependent oxidoreductase [bacterium]|nr:NAD(P)/FAD-dependent oxidoreductase [bacterium]
MTKYDLGIIGAGPAGFTAALLAADKGQSVILFEKDKIGGTCLNKGCIPTKTILHSTDLFNDIKNAQNLGIVANDINFDFAKAMERKNKVVDTLRNALTKNLENKGIKIVYAEAKIIDNNTIGANNEQYKTEKIIIASGSNPRELKGLEFDHKFILNSDDLFEMTNIPKKVAIVGAGAEGIEWARIFKNIDCDVTVIEAAPRLLAIADEEVSKYIERMFKVRKINFKLSTTVDKIEDKKVILSNGEILEPDFVLVAVGRTVNIPDNSENLTIIGDADNKIMLANFAMQQAKQAILGTNIENTIIPSVIYGTPEIAWIGKKEQDLTDGTYKKSVFPIRALGKAHCDNEIEGFIKILSIDEKIVGAHIISKEASAMIHQLLVAMENNIEISKLKDLCFAHPTFSEGIYESILGL